MRGMPLLPSLLLLLAFGSCCWPLRLAAARQAPAWQRRRLRAATPGPADVHRQVPAPATPPPEAFKEATPVGDGNNAAHALIQLMSAGITADQASEQALGAGKTAASTGCGGGAICRRRE